MTLAATGGIEGAAGLITAVATLITAVALLLRTRTTHRKLDNVERTLNNVEVDIDGTDGEVTLGQRVKRMERGAQATRAELLSGFEDNSLQHDAIRSALSESGRHLRAVADTLDVHIADAKPRLERLEDAIRPPATEPRETPPEDSDVP